MLEDTRGLVSFMRKLTALTGGQVIRAQSQELQQGILSGYLRRREDGP